MVRSALSVRLLALAVVPLLAAGCAGGPDGVRIEAGADGAYHVAMTSQMTFDPPEAIVPVGATVVWHNNATMAHDVAGYKGDPIKDDTTQFSSDHAPPEGLGRLIESGESFQHTFSEKGTWTIWCHTHHEERMKQILHVV